MIQIQIALLVSIQGTIHPARVLHRIATGMVVQNRSLVVLCLESVRFMTRLAAQRAGRKWIETGS